jgi:hypothetical protein
MQVYSRMEVDKMDEENPIREMFDSLLDETLEKKIMRMIIDGKQSNEIIEELLKKE